MTRLELERFERLSTNRAARVRAWAGERAADELAGRTVWCAAASPHGRTAARTLGELLRPSPGDVAADPLDVSGGEPLRTLARRLDAMLSGGGPPPAAALGAEEAELCAEAAGVAEALMGRAVARGDVVVVHDVLTALLAGAARERGAHTVWHVHATSPDAPGAVRGTRVAYAFLRRYTSAVDAYIMTWPEPAGHGRVVERVAAAMPEVDVVATKEIPTGDDPGAPRTLAWRTALADVVTDDRADHVGGTVRVRPAVAAR
ncbi:MAG: hypothetical protein QOK49_252 [Baekduia sp.]|jgi:hypothetical protein|nr:hypothetical protein [Baekduia sp.]